MSTHLRRAVAVACVCLALVGCGKESSDTSPDASCQYACGRACCARGQTCDFESETCSDKCAPDCNRRSCGDDGCGGSCGSCGPGTVCNDAEGQCVAAPAPDAGFGLDAGASRPDASTPPPCDPWAQTGCAQGQKCTVVDFANLGFSCGPAGDKGTQVACANDGECAPGLVCVDFGKGLKCHGLCNASRICPSDERCLGIARVGQTPFICLPITRCDPLAQDCPLANQGCYPLSGSPDAEWACFVSGARTRGQSCVASTDCVEGYICHTLECAQICNVAGGEPSCDTGSCQQWTAAAGYCL